RRIFSGEDFTDGQPRRPDLARYMEPLREIARAYSLPVLDPEVARNYRATMQNRLELGCDPIPHHIVLHGSRGNGTSSNKSDFDLLFLYRDGASVEYFVTQADGAPPVELEYSAVGRFESIATRPVDFPLFGPLELAKIAQGIMLWGDSDLWERWSAWLLESALELGRTYWLLCLLGMQVRPEKVAGLLPRFRSALAIILNRANATRYEEDLALLSREQFEPLAGHLRRLLDKEVPTWRVELAEGKRIFARQVPEVWTAFRLLGELQ